MKLRKFAEYLVLKSDGEKLRTKGAADYETTCDTLAHNFRATLQESHRQAAYMILVDGYDEETFLDQVAEQIKQHQQAARRNTGINDYVYHRLMASAWGRIHEEARQLLRD
jgi:hypothetical protein